MEWIIRYYDTIGFWVFVLDQIATATPEDMVICKLPIGRWDNMVVKGIKGMFKAILKREKGKG